MAGIVLKYIRSYFSVFNTNTCIIDLGVSKHTCCDSNTFIFLKSFHVPLHKNLPNSFKVTVTHTGKIRISAAFILENVLHFPSFKYNISLVNMFCVQFHYIIIFSPKLCLLQTLLIKRAQVFGE